MRWFANLALNPIDLLAPHGNSTARAVLQLAAQSEARQVLIFLDEIEALGFSRDMDMHEASRKLLSVLLRKVDGFQVPPCTAASFTHALWSSSIEKNTIGAVTSMHCQANHSTLVIGATNRVGDIDRHCGPPAVQSRFPAFGSRACVLRLWLVVAPAVLFEVGSIFPSASIFQI